MAVIIGNRWQVKSLVVGTNALAEKYENRNISLNSIPTLAGLHYSGNPPARKQPRMSFTAGSELLLAKYCTYQCDIFRTNITAYPFWLAISAAFHLFLQWRLYIIVRVGRSGDSATVCLDRFPEQDRLLHASCGLHFGYFRQRRRLSIQLLQCPIIHEQFARPAVHFNQIIDTIACLFSIITLCNRAVAFRAEAIKVSVAIEATSIEAQRLHLVIVHLLAAHQINRQMFVFTTPRRVNL